MDIVERRAINERQRGVTKPDVLLQRRATGGVVLGCDVAEYPALRTASRVQCSNQSTGLICRTKVRRTSPQM